MTTWMMKLVATSLTLALAACGAGEGGDFSDIETTVVGTCGTCHDVLGFDALLTDIRALPESAFTADQFPDFMFTLDVREESVADLISAANPPKDATIDPDAPLRMAWILTQMHELELQLVGTPSSDFTDREGFEAYNGFGDVIPQGCETLNRLQLAAENSPSQMPPPWTEPLFDALGIEFVPLTSDDRDALIDSVTSSLPTGGSACF
jgi:hypothetical protein